MLSVLFILPFSAVANTQWHWEANFSNAEKTRLKQWINTNDAGLDAIVGPLPYRFRVHFFRHNGSEPVPWAETNKRRGRAVHFYVNTGYDQAAFLADWTAAHELSHLMFPYLGEDSRWFAEGIASYLQYQIMYASGQLSWAQATGRMQTRFRRARSSFRGAGLSLLEHSRRLDRVRGHPRLYWGGAAYFMQAEQRLWQEKGLRLTDVIQQYMACCYQAWNQTALDMLAHFDRISQSKIFTEQYLSTVTKGSFPDTAEALAWLKQHPPALSAAKLSAAK